MKYWIIGQREDEETLKRLGVKIGRWDTDEEEFRDCEITDLDAIDQYWGPQD